MAFDYTSCITVGTLLMLWLPTTVVNVEDLILARLFVACGLLLRPLTTTSTCLFNSYSYVPDLFPNASCCLLLPYMIGHQVAGSLFVLSLASQLIHRGSPLLIDLVVSQNRVAPNHPILAIDRNKPAKCRQMPPYD